MYLKFDHMHINSIKENLFALGLKHLAKILRRIEI